MFQSSVVYIFECACVRLREVPLSARLFGNDPMRRYDLRRHLDIRSQHLHQAVFDSAIQMTKIEVILLVENQHFCLMQNQGCACAFAFVALIWTLQLSTWLGLNPTSMHSMVVAAAYCLHVLWQHIVLKCRILKQEKANLKNLLFTVFVVCLLHYIVVTWLLTLLAQILFFRTSSTRRLTICGANQICLRSLFLFLVGLRVGLLVGLRVGLLVGLEVVRWQLQLSLAASWKISHSCLFFALLKYSIAPQVVGSYRSSQSFRTLNPNASGVPTTLPTPQGGQTYVLTFRQDDTMVRNEAMRMVLKIMVWSIIVLGMWNAILGRRTCFGFLWDPDFLKKEERHSLAFTLPSVNVIKSRERQLGVWFLGILFRRNTYVQTCARKRDHTTYCTSRKIHLGR
jgi:hypothetical protein